MSLRWRPGVVEGSRAIGMAAEAQREKAKIYRPHSTSVQLPLPEAHPQVFAQLLGGLKVRSHPKPCPAISTTEMTVRWLLALVMALPVPAACLTAVPNLVSSSAWAYSSHLFSVI